MKKCTQCGIEKLEWEFSRQASSKSGRRPNCRKCAKKSALRYRSQNLKRIRQAERESAMLHPRYAKGVMWQQSRARARYRKLEFDIEIEDIVIPTHCPVLGIPLVKNSGKNCSKSNSPSLDRIDNSRGYVKGNIAVISGRANRLKNDASLTELQQLVYFMENFTSGK